MIATPAIDELQHLQGDSCGAGCWCAGAVFKPVGAFGPIAGHPFRECGAGDAGFSGDVSDGPAACEDAGDEALSSFRGQWGVSVGHRSGSLSAGWLLRHHPSCSPGARSFIPDR